MTETLMPADLRAKTRARLFNFVRLLANELKITC